MLKLSGGITKHLCNGYAPFYLLEDSDISFDEWTTFKSNEFKEQYKEYICPVCGHLHLKKSDVELLYGYCKSS